MLKFLLGLCTGIFIGVFTSSMFQINNINEKEDEIWQLKIENKDLRKQIYSERKNK